MKFPPVLEFTPEFEELRLRVNTKKETLDSRRPFLPIVVKKLRQDFLVEWTYNSNSIEGNTLNLIETKVVLQDGLTVGGKTLREHFEVLNHKKAIEYLEDLVDSFTVLRSIDLLNIHALVLANIIDDFAGRFRTGMVRVTGANFTHPNARLVPDFIDELIDYINLNVDNLEPLVLATIFHHRFVWVHPFIDGNGRSVRLAMNLLLMRAGFPPVFILAKDRQKYYAALNAANTGDYKKLLLMMYQAAERSLDIYLSSAGGDYDDYLPTSYIANEPEVPYGQEYLSLLARNGRIDAYKDGNAWLTTKTAVLDYIKIKRK